MPAGLKTEIIGVADKARWNRLLAKSLYPSYRQTLEFEHARAERGREVCSVLFSRDGNDIAGATYSILRSGWNLFSTADILSGFILTETPGYDLICHIIDHFIEFANEKNVDFLRIRTWLPAIVAGSTTGYQTLLTEVLESRGFRYDGAGRDTYWIDLGRSEEDILAGMKRQTRYDIKQGLKSQISTQEIDYPDDTVADNFWSLYKDIAERKGFNSYTEAKFKSEINTLLTAKLASIFILTYQGKPVNYSVASNFGIASYLHGAIDTAYRDYAGCPPPGPLAQWKMILEMKSKKALFYDMGFCPGPVPVKGHPLFNIWRFKYGFGGEHIKFTDGYYKSLRKVKGGVFRLIKAM